MKKRLAALAMAFLLVGCSPDLTQYPRVSSSLPPITPQTLVLNLPQDPSPVLLDSVTRFGAALLELSGGALTLESVSSSNPLVALQSGEATLALLTNEDLVAADSSLAFLALPMLFSGPEEFLTILGAPDGPVRSSQRLATALGGSVLGVWYGGSASLLCRGFFYDDICFSGSAVGLLEGLPHGDLLTGMDENLAAKTVLTADADTLLSKLEDKELKYAECFLDGGQDPLLTPTIKYLERTHHRIQGLWLTLAAGAVDPATASLLQAAAAYVPLGQLEGVVAAQDAQAQRLADSGVKVKSGAYPNFHKAAKDYYRRNYAAAGIPERIWQQLRPLL